MAYSGTQASSRTYVEHPRALKRGSCAEHGVSSGQGHPCGSDVGVERHEPRSGHTDAGSAAEREARDRYSVHISETTQNSCTANLNTPLRGVDRIVSRLKIYIFDL